MKKLLHNNKSVLCELSHVEFTKLAKIPDVERVPDGTSVDLSWVAKALNFYNDKNAKLGILKGKLDYIQQSLNEALDV